MTKTYFVIKSSNISLEQLYQILQAKKPYDTAQEALAAIKGSDPDIIPKDSNICFVTETTEFKDTFVKASVEIRVVNIDSSEQPK